MFPGLTGLALAAAAVVLRATRRDVRTRMFVAIGITGVALSFGPALPGYGLLHAHVPLFEGLRAAARWGVLLLMAVAGLAGIAVAALERRWRGATYWPAASVAIPALITLEALRAPMAFVPTPPVPALYAQLRDAPGVVLAELPLYSGVSVSENARYLFAATRHFRPLVNGYSGFESERFRQQAARWREFPGAAVLAEMRALGVTHITVHQGAIDGSGAEAAAARGDLELLGEEGEVRLYRVRP